ncbi:non-specific lipid transfer protein GPI-anchored 9-like [Tasmannia lanceolata]|uniref:non-specific lipid transfer protein GPI-anchored 9-like n=1 Tax=Tasmannia lanceolata TaxID=3420 RepID=UPI004062D648
MGSSRVIDSGVSVLLAVFLSFVLIGNNGVSGQQTPQCASELVPCANYLNSTSPPQSCCGPLKLAVANDLACLCNLFKNPGIFASFGINMTQALELPKHCGITSGIDACTSGAPPPTAGAPPGAAAGGSQANSAVKMERVGMSSMAPLLLLLCASFMA